MKKYKTFACSKIVAIVTAFAVALWLPAIVITLVSSAEMQLENIIIVCIYFAMVGILAFVPYRNAFSIVCFDCNGVKNKHANLKWGEINSVYLVDIDVFKYKLPHIPVKIICISNKTDSSSFSIWRSDKERIFVSLNKKNLAMLAKYSKKTVDGTIS